MRLITVSKLHDLKVGVTPQLLHKYIRTKLVHHFDPPYWIDFQNQKCDLRNIWRMRGIFLSKIVDRYFSNYLKSLLTFGHRNNYLGHRINIWQPHFRIVLKTWIFNCTLKIIVSINKRESSFKYLSNLSLDLVQ